MDQPSVFVLSPRVELIGALLREHPHPGGIVAYEDAAELLASARKAEVWLIVLDFRGAKAVSEGVVRKARAVGAQPEVLIVPPAGDVTRLDLPMDCVVEAGATDERIVEQARRLLALQRVRAESGIVGSAPRIRELLSAIAQVAPLDVSVLVQGESGTGKEMVARALHARSARSTRPFISINVGSLAESLLESELFGHEKGAFTGAVARHAGVFERANGGTLFLDELGEMSPAMQVKLLRVLETGEFQRVGGTQTLRTDVRIVAATHRDLETEMNAGRFRGDLYYRLKVVKLEIPPLRERPEDILILARHFLDESNQRHGLSKRGMTTVVMERLRGYAWPGNVRELRNVIASMSVMSRGEFLDAGDLPEELQDLRSGSAHLPIRADGPFTTGDADGLWTTTLLALVADVRRIAERIDEIGRRLDLIDPRSGADRPASGQEVDSGGWDEDATDAEFVPLHSEGPTDMAGAERAMIEATLRQFEGNRRKTAAQLGIGERTLYRKLRQYGIG